jgi:hypothetical protein
MKVMQDNNSGSPILENIWADLGLLAPGTKRYELVRDGLPFVFLDRIGSYES